MTDELFDSDASAQFKRNLAAVLEPLLQPPTFTWHSTTIAEDGRLVVLFEDGDRRTWCLSGDPRDGAPMAFLRVD